jgi:hypothetical protein
MSTTCAEDRKFLADVIGEGCLESAMTWIGQNKEPEDVFSEDALERWARQNGFVLESEVPPEGALP